MDEEYEILPKDELDELRNEIKKIQKNPFGDTEESKTLLDSMGALTNSINKLLALFEKTQKELLDEYEKNNPAEALNDVLDQNEKIAKGTLAVADLVKKQQQDINEIKNAVIKPEIIPNTPPNPLEHGFEDNKIPDMNNPFGARPQQNQANPFGAQPQQNQANPFAQTNIPKKVEPEHKKGLFGRNK